MISERQFARGFSSFWQALLPMGDAFVRRVNLGYERFNNSYRGHSSPARRAFINEAAFEIFRVSQELKEPVSYPTLEHPLVIERLKVSHARTSLLYASPSQPSSNPPLSELESHEALELAKRTIKYFQTRERASRLTLDPLFSGCGFIDHCIGDVLAGETLYEVKSGDRSFRSIDFRQLVIYCALNYSSKSSNITSIGLVNPRHGTFFRCKVDEFSFALTGKGAAELFNEILEFISSGGVSR